MNLCIKIIIILIMFLASINANEKILKIAIAKDIIPYSFLDENNKISGLLVDYWKLWSKKTGQKIEFVVSSWPMSLENIKNKKADLHFAMFYEKNRKKDYEFLFNLFNTKSSLYIDKKNNNKFMNIKDLKHIAVIKNSYYEKYLKKYYKNIKITKVNFVKDLITLLSQNKVDGILSSEQSLKYGLLKAVKLFKFKKIKTFKLKKYFFLTLPKNHKNHKKLKKLLLKGINLISNNELQDIENNWINEDLNYNKRILNKDEILYLDKNPIINMVFVKEWKRISFINKKSELVGFHVDLLKEINKNLNINLQIKLFNSWNEAYTAAKNDENIGIFGLSKTKEREKIFSYSKPYYSTIFHVINRKNIKNYDNKIAVVQKELVAAKYIEKYFPKSKIIFADTYKDTFTMLKNKEADFSLIEGAASYNIKKYDLKINQNLFFIEGDLHIGNNKTNTLLYSILKKALNSVPNSKITELKNKWLNEKQLSIFTKKELEYINKSSFKTVAINSWGNINFLNINNDFDGLVGDILKKIENISGLKFKAVKNTWHNNLEAFKNNKIDIIPDMFYSKEREKLGLFTDSYFTVQDFIYLNKSNKSIKNFEDLNNKKLAIVKSYGQINIIKKHFPLIEIVETKDLEDSFAKLLNNDIDALFDSQFNVELKLKELLIKNIKGLAQNDIKSNVVHMISSKNDFLLQSILKKSLNSISKNEKNIIISKWLNKKIDKKTLNIYSGKGREPYTFEKTYLKGIEYDIFKEVLKEFDFITQDNFNYGSIYKEFKKNKNIDLAVGLKEKKDEFFYSDVFVSFENVIISRNKDKYSIKNIDDLKNKRIIAFEGASKYLGEEFKKLFNNRNNLYEELRNQEKQVQKFLDKKTDLIIMDLNIFKWYLNALSSESFSLYQISRLFPKKNDFKVVFRNELLRDVFNKNLTTVRKNGKYKEIVENYTDSDIGAKVKINSLLSSLFSKYIFENNITSIKEIFKVFKALNYIDKIEVFSNDNLRIYSSSDQKFDKYMQQDSFYILDNIPKKIGFIRVYFNETNLIRASLKARIIPKLEHFINFTEYVYIKNTYTNFKYDNKKIVFSKKEKNFIKNNPIITFSEVNWQPLSILENNKFKGLINDYMKILEEKSSIHFKYIKSDSWPGVINDFMEKKIDLVPSVTKEKRFINKALFSVSYEKFNFAIVTDEKGTYVKNFKELENKILAIPKGFTSYHIVKDLYPNVKIIETKSIKEALALVVEKKAYAFIGHEAVAVFNLKHYFKNLKIVGFTSFEFKHHFLIQKDQPELLSIINKIIESISFEEKEKIRDKWIKYSINTAVDYSIIFYMLVIFVTILLIVLYFLQKLKLVKNKIEEQKNNFEQLFNESSDAIALIKDGQYIKYNKSSLKMYGSKNAENVKDLSLGILSPKFQEDGTESKIKMQKLLKICEKEGSVRFEWLCKKTNGELFWTDSMMTLIKQNKDNLFHIISRDISDKKILEKEIHLRNKDLEESILHLQQTQKQLVESEKMASLGGLVAGVAHEINTPVGISLTGITHLEELTQNINKKYIKEEMSQEEFEEYLLTSKDISILIHKNLEKAASLVRSFKQISVDQSSEAKREFNLKHYVDEILESLHHMIKKTNIKIDVVCQTDIKLNSYAGAYSQIFTNLIMNSLVHAFDKKDKGEILINISKNEKELIISYKDNGKGIKKENLNKIFDPFYTTNRDNGGSGLGLNIIYNIITVKLNGVITCNSKENEGVEFIISLKI